MHILWYVTVELAAFLLRGTKITVCFTKDCVYDLVKCGLSLLLSILQQVCGYFPLEVSSLLWLPSSGGSGVGRALGRGGSTAGSHPL